MVFGKLFGRRKAASQDLKLVVQGVITESGRHTPRTHLGPNSAPEEAYFALEIRTAALSDGQSQPAASVVPAEFSGPVSLLEKFAVGDTVQITATTATGRMIDHMQPFEG